MNLFKAFTFITICMVISTICACVAIEHTSHITITTTEKMVELTVVIPNTPPATMKLVMSLSKHERDIRIINFLKQAIESLRGEKA